MSTFLDDLGQELDRVAAHLVEGRRPRRPVWPALGFAAAAAAAVLLVVVLAGGARPVERDIAAPKPARLGLPAPPKQLRDIEISVQMADPPRRGSGLTLLGNELRQAGWKVADDASVAPADRSVRTVKIVYDAPVTRDQAEQIAGVLGIDTVHLAPGPSTDGLTIVSGRDPRLGVAVDGYRSRFHALGPDGSATVTTPHGRVGLLVSGADLCLYAHKVGLCEYAELGTALVTPAEGGGRQGFGLAPDGVRYVTLSTGRRLRVHDNVWTTGRTDARWVRIRGVGKVDL